MGVQTAVSAGLGETPGPVRRARRTAAWRVRRRPDAARRRGTRIFGKGLAATITAGAGQPDFSRADRPEITSARIFSGSTFRKETFA